LTPPAPDQAIRSRSRSGIHLEQLGEIEVRFTAELTIQLLRCGPPTGGPLAGLRADSGPVSSDPLVGGLAHVEGTDQGIVDLRSERQLRYRFARREPPVAGWLDGPAGFCDDGGIRLRWVSGDPIPWR
jgi:hypothetical protein